MEKQMYVHEKYTHIPAFAFFATILSRYVNNIVNHIVISQNIQVNILWQHWQHIVTIWSTLLSYLTIWLSFVLTVCDKNTGEIWLVIWLNLINYRDDFQNWCLYLVNKKVCFKSAIRNIFQCWAFNLYVLIESKSF